MNAGAIFAAGRRCGGGRRLDQRYAGSLRTLCALADFELNALVLIEGLEAAGLDFGVVDEDVPIRIIRCNEAQALFSVEPLDGSLCHLFLLIVELFKIGTPRAGLGHSARRILFSCSPEREPAVQELRARNLSCEHEKTPTQRLR